MTLARRFIHDTVGARVVFGPGRLSEVPAEAARLGSKPLVIYDGFLAEVAKRLLDDFGQRVAGTIDRVRQHVPAEDAEAARERARELGADSLVCLGGGSAIGLAKAIALTERLPILAVPTTYAGSEVTPVWGMTEGKVKMTGREPVVAPRTVVYDPELTYDLPAPITASSGLNALAHCIDALWAPGRSPLTDATAELGIRMLATALPRAVRDGQDPEARAGALVGAWLAGHTFAVAGTSIHHKLCHALGGRYDLPHAETHAVVLPWVVELLLPDVPAARAVLERALDASDPVAALRVLSREIGAPARLADFGLTGEQAAALAEGMNPAQLAAPRPITREELQELLRRATVG